MRRWSVLAVAALLLWTMRAVAAEKPIAFSVHSAKSGNWSEASTWREGRTPAAGENVQIAPGTTVTYDVANGPDLRAVHVAGTLRFSREKSTVLSAGLIKITPGEACSEDGFVCDAHVAPPVAPAAGASQGDRPALEIGTADQPIPAGIKATIRLVYFDGMDKETLPAIMSCGGRWDVHGAPMNRTWVKLGADAKKGETAITLAEPVTGWNVGDRVIVTSSSEVYGYSDTFRSKPGKPAKTNTEERLITAIDGVTIQLDKPLAVAHLGHGDYRAEIANLSRNVVVESADPAGVRGHTMYHAGSTGGISYAEFRHLGKEGVLGKYAIHFHLVRDGMRGSGVIGASVWDSQNRWVTIHGTDYLLVRDCVGYQSVGHGFFLEDGTEQYNIFDRNLAVQAYRGKRLKGQVLGFDNNEGAGFWWANGRNTLVRNVSCENDRYGFKFELRGKMESRLRMPDGELRTVDTRTLPFIRFEENEAHCDGLYAMNFGDESNANPSVRGDVSHPFIARNLKVWESHYVLRPNLQFFLLDGLDVWNAVYGIYNPDYDAHVYRNIHFDHVVSEPINRGLDDTDEQRGSFTYENVTIENCRTGRDPIIQMSITSPRVGQSGHFKNLVLRNCKSNANVVDLGGGPRNTRIANGVAYYFHGYPTPADVTKIVSPKNPEMMKDAEYQPIKDFTGKDARGAVVTGVPFPTLLTPIDDLPPATTIRSVQKVNDKLIVIGLSQDNGDVASVTVNRVPATILSSSTGLTEWRAQLDAPADGILTASAIDRAGNVEKNVHRLSGSW
ncbi:MAG: hypothetical protein JWN40_4321 [Phycisphaerales bacterium]|nr:hypothetical protein [Phycisphaerales bacterium]